MNEFIKKYKGAIIGIIVAILILVTRLYTIILWMVVITLGAIVGNYVQKNKERVKIKLKSIIDKF